MKFVSAIKHKVQQYKLHNKVVRNLLSRFYIKFKKEHTNEKAEWYKNILELITAKKRQNKIMIHRGDDNEELQAKLGELYARRDEVNAQYDVLKETFGDCFNIYDTKKNGFIMSIATLFVKYFRQLVIGITIVFLQVDVCLQLSIFFMTNLVTLSFLGWTKRPNDPHDEMQMYSEVTNLVVTYHLFFLHYLNKTQNGNPEHLGNSLIVFTIFHLVHSFCRSVMLDCRHKLRMKYYRMRQKWRNFKLRD